MVPDPNSLLGLPRRARRSAITAASHRLAKSFALLFLSAAAAGCAFDFTPQVTPLVVEPLPPPKVFVTPGAVVQPPPALESTDQPGLEILPIEETPTVPALCTTSSLYLRVEPSATAQELALMPSGSEVAWGGNQTPADGYVWYQVSTASGLQGWAASDWLAPGACGQSSVPGGFPAIVDGAYASGSTWLGTTANCDDCTHFGVDIGPGTGDTEIYAPWSGEIVAYDSCEGCPEGEGNTYNEDNAIAEDYNWGYGATVLVEYSYESIGGGDLQRLQDQGIDLQPGQSLYMMFTHLDRQVTQPESGTALAAGDAVAVMDNSGNSEGLHAHVELAINDSGLTQGTDSTLFGFWWNEVAEVDFNAQTTEGRQGNRVDPTGLFNLP